MADTKEQILAFLDKCEEFKTCKFIMATTKIKDLLKCIVNCPKLYRLFETVTKDFDYPAVKSSCLIKGGDSLISKNCVVLPQTVGQRLAFIFCLLFEFDRDSMNFNDFLRTYFAEDGSYFASYQAFCNTIIRSLQDCVAQVFAEELSTPSSVSYGNSRMYSSEMASALNLAVSQEMQFVSQSLLPEEEKQNGLKILSALYKSIKDGDEDLIDACLCGYNYFALHTNCISDGITEIIKLIEEYEKVL